MDKIVGLIMVCIAFAGPIAAYRLCYMKDKDEGGGLLVVVAVIAAIIFGIMGIGMIVEGGL